MYACIISTRKAVFRSGFMNTQSSPVHQDLLRISISSAGNGYDESWIKEAQKRGLSNYASTPEALAHYLDKKKRQCLYKDRCAVFDGIIVKV